MIDRSVLLLTSCAEDAEWITKFCRKAFAEVVVCKGDWGQPIPEVCDRWRGDLVVSYCSRWIVPQGLLERASLAAINFHPAPPEYPGIGGLNWALYNDSESFGATCHHMVPKVDAGPIIEVRRFPIFRYDDVESLFRRTHLYLELLGLEVLNRIAKGETLPSSSESWSTRVWSRRELNELANISPDMSPEEITRRVRAYSFGRWQPAVTLGNHTFELKK